MLACISILYRRKAIKTTWYKSSFQHYDLRLQFFSMLYVYYPTFFVTCLLHVPFILNCIETAINPPQLHHLVPLPRFHTPCRKQDCTRTPRGQQVFGSISLKIWPESLLHLYIFYHITSSLLSVHICLCFPLPVKKLCMNCPLPCDHCALPL